MRPSLRAIGVLFCILLISLRATAKEDTYPLKHLVIADTEQHAADMKVDETKPVSVEGVSILAEPEFNQAVAKYFGRPITIPMLNEIAKTITDYAKKHDRLIGKVQVPNQNVSTGVVRLGVSLVHYSEVQVRGNRWFSSKLIQERLGVTSGEEVQISKLDEAINWVNTNPFRQIKVLVNDVTSDPTKADLIVGVRERVPVRGVFSYDDSGTDVLGNNHYTAGVQFGNLWGLDHQASYQFVTTDSLHQYQAHVFDYKVPLPWRHFVELSGSYVRARPVFGNGLFGQDAENISTSLRYTVPLRSGANPADWFIGTDFKESNNNLEFGGESVLNTKVDTFQLVSGFTTVTRDKLGAWMFGASVFFSPGHINSRNSSAAYQAARYGSSPTYMYGTLNVQRTLLLGKGWDLYSRLVGQASNRNLVGNEELTIGGANTVRGFNTNVYAGDEGFVFCNDLNSPVWSQHLPFTKKDSSTLDTRFALFYDAAQVFLRHRYDFDPVMTPLASTGVGIRMSISNNFSLNFDYGWQITRLPYANTEHARGHIKVVVAF